MTANLRPPHCSDEDIASLIDGRHAHPKSVLGLHTSGREVWLTALLPGAEKVSAKIGRKMVELSQVRGPVFAAKVPKSKSAHVFEVTYADGSVVKVEDAYRFGQHIGELDLHLIGEGTHKRLWEVLGAHVTEIDGVAGTHFALWAPNAQRVSIIGGFNLWNGIAHPMERLGSSGVWELFLPGVSEGALYKYSVLDSAGQELEKADPVAFGSQHPPETASVVRDITGYGWSDGEWIDKRHAINRRDQPISIYEVHLGSWRRKVEEDGRRLSYKELAKELVEYASWMGFTHLEFLPVSEFPFDGSWGYQPVGLYAPTIRFGPPHEFRDLVDAAHNAGLGIILDWVPGHFPSDAHGLAEFDGTHLYEYADPKEGFHQDWNTLIYNYGRTEVKNYLVANALYWLEEYHVDGLRVDAVASMLYRDYSRAAGEWVPNKDGGRENYEAIAFLQDMNVQAYGENAGIMTVAEESTAFPQVSSPVDAGGLGFGFKWNMGWMNDTLRYMEKDPVHRAYDHHLMTFGIDYAFTENFILPISHDEVVHGKGSMIEKMPGDPAQKLANLRAYYGYMWGHPGKKLLFMGCEFAQGREWNHDVSLDWDAAQANEHRGVQLLVRDLNRLYADTPALHRLDCDPSGFRWIANYPEQSILSFARFGEDGDAPAFVVCNFTPIERTDFRIGVPKAGRWIEKLNTDAAIYGGEDRGNLGEAATEAVEWDGFAQSVSLTIPPLSTLIFVCDD